MPVQLQKPIKMKKTLDEFDGYFGRPVPSVVDACGRRSKFTRAFAPQEGMVTKYEEPARQELCLNGSWQFQGTADTSVPGAEATGLGPWDAVPIRSRRLECNGFSMDRGARAAISAPIRPTK